MRTLFLKIHIVRLVCVLLLSFFSVVTQAHLNRVPNFLEKHVRVEAIDAKDGPRLQTQFDYSADEALITRNLLKMSNEGYEDHMTVGIVQSYGSVNASVIYNLHRFNYTNRDEQTDDVTVGFQYQALKVQHRFEERGQASKIGLPFDLFAAQIDLSFTQTLQHDSDDTISVYSFVSQFNGLKLSVSRKEMGEGTWLALNSEYQHFDDWLIKVGYTDDGYDVQTRFGGQYNTAAGYRLAGEYKLQTDERDQNRIAGAVSIEKGTELAALRLRVEYDDGIDSQKTLLFKIQSEVVF